MTRLLLVLLCSSAFFLAQAQITILSTDIPSAPDTLRNAVDTLPVGIAPGPKGANQTWNFANAVQDITETVYHRVPSQTPYSADFPTATNAITADNSNYGYFQKTSSAFTCQGLAGPLLGAGTTPVSVQFNPTFDLFRFPTNYNNNFTGNYGFQETASGSSVGQPVDQVRLTYTATYWDTIDGWGTVITPLGSYQALRQKRREISYTHVEFKLLSFSPWATAEEIRDTVITYTWLAKETLGQVAAITFNDAGAVNRFTYSLTPPAPVANFSWANPSGGLVQFTDLSTNSPTSWSWDFDNGSPLGTTQNPNHIYVANGTYDVCLTVTNATGSDTHCETVTVSNIGIGNSAPVAVTDSANMPYETAVDIAVLDNDIDPEGNVMSVTGVTVPAANGTTFINSDGTITYTPNTGFSGFDSFQYSICDDGVPSLCDTATVYVTVDAPPARPNFTYDSECLTVEFTNTSTGYTGLVAWTFGDGTNGIGENVTHTYDSAGTYNVCVTVSGFTGAIDTCYDITLDTCGGVGILTLNNVNLHVYPNPAHDQLTVVVPNGTQGGNLAIINNLGMLVKEVAVTDNRTNISISDLAAGIYHLTYTTTDGTKGAGRFVKE